VRLVKDVDAVCLVVLAGKTPRKLAPRCLQLLIARARRWTASSSNAVRDSLRSAYDNPFTITVITRRPAETRPRAPRTLPTPLSVSKPDMGATDDLTDVSVSYRWTKAVESVAGAS